MSEMGHCKDCRCFERRTYADQKNVGDGWCHRHAPSPQPEHIVSMHFPLMDEEDYCFEFEMRVTRMVDRGPGQ